MWINDKLYDQLEWLGVYAGSSNSSNYSVENINYGSAASQFNLTKSVPKYINFTEPMPPQSGDYSKNSSLKGEFQWVFVNYNSNTSNTTVKAVFLDHTQANRINSTSFELSGLHHLLAHSSNYILLEDVNGTVDPLLFFKYNYISGTYVRDSMSTQALLTVFSSSNNSSNISM